ncbi:MAG: tyrosine-type recombinase/integrase, partial [Fimbriimonadaceae bacterium]|nr:tyrosine-type recombinase/integrase [Alphaproteobacteria bacterium]
DLRDRYDSNQTRIQKALQTDDLRTALDLRDAVNAAVEKKWAILRAGGTSEEASEKTKFGDVVKLANTLGYTYKTGHELAAAETVDEILERVSVVAEHSNDLAVAAAVLGKYEKPKVTVTEAFEIYCNEIAAGELTNKSAVQKAAWKKTKNRAVQNFVNLIGKKKTLVDITREEALRFYRFWNDKIQNDGLSASSGNRDVGNMRKLFDSYTKHIGEFDLDNPFRALSFTGRKKKRPPFSVEWLRTRILKPDVLNKLNQQARDILITMVDTGCRPSEIANIEPADIHLETEIPYIHIRATDDREIKTESSERFVPLVGLALDTMRRNPGGFPRYQDKQNSLSAVMMKWLKENNLLETPDHKVYSIRHTFADRMREAGVDSELRKILMGHAVTDRPNYGTGGSLELHRNELQKIVFAEGLDI